MTVKRPSVDDRSARPCHDPASLLPRTEVILLTASQSAEKDGPCHTWPSSGVLLFFVPGLSLCPWRAAESRQLSPLILMGGHHWLRCENLGLLLDLCEALVRCVSSLGTSCRGPMHAGLRRPVHGCKLGVEAPHRMEAEGKLPGGATGGEETEARPVWAFYRRLRPQQGCLSFYTGPDDRLICCAKEGTPPVGGVSREQQLLLQRR